VCVCVCVCVVRFSVVLACRYSGTVYGSDPPRVHGITHKQAIAGWMEDSPGKGHNTPGGPWKLLSNESSTKLMDKCGTYADPLRAVCLVPLAERSLIS
jgi:hypothetical protein